MRRRDALGCAAAGAMFLAGCDGPSARPTKLRWSALDVHDLYGRRSRLEVVASSARLVNFWAMWCPPCRHELPSLQRLAAEREEGIEVCAVALADDYFGVREYLAQHAAGLPCVVMRQDDPALRQLDVAVLPQTFLVSAKGDVLTRWVGERDWHSKSMRAEISGKVKGA